MDMKSYPDTPSASTDPMTCYVAEIERLQRENKNLRGQNQRLLRHLLNPQPDQQPPMLDAA